MKFTATNHDPNVKARAGEWARRLTAETGKVHTVEYRDHFNDYSVRGDYVVIETARRA